jgi:phosphatidylserine decarboxylase
MTIHKEGKWYCLAGTVIFLVLLVALSQLFPHWHWAFFIFAVPLFLIWLWVFWFFRIPNKAFIPDPNAIYSPCDGKVVVIEETNETEYYKDRRLQISVFMSPLNVHNNLYPISGEVDYVQYHPGKFLVAWHPKSSTENERSTIVVKNEHISVLMRQIAGALARRIVTYSQKGQQVNQHQELGFIKFGSRVDIYLPIGTHVDAQIGDVVQGGLSKLATIKK